MHGYNMDTSILLGATACWTSINSTLGKVIPFGMASLLSKIYKMTAGLHVPNHVLSRGTKDSSFMVLV